MKCPKCGCEIEEGKLLCENCGEEVKIVPDFEPEIESQINETLGNIAKSFFEKEKADEEENAEFVQEKWNEQIDPFGSMKGIVSLCVLVLAIIAFVCNIVFTKKHQTYEYQYEKALQYIDESQIQNAIDSLDRALAIDDSHVDGRILLANLYVKQEKINSAMKILEEAILLDSEYRSEAYLTLLGLYETQQEYQKMGDLLKGCPFEEIYKKFERFAAPTPVFNVEDGVYDKVQSITMKCDTEGIIYYTMDGSTPTRNSMVYEYPVVLESGNYTIKSLFVNMYGVESDIVSKSYYINLAKPKEPDISLDSGTYDSPQKIEIFHDADTKVYYTLDGTVPTNESLRYTEPIEMLYGMSNLSVVAITDKGISSDVVKRTYHLNVETNFSPDLAMRVLKDNLLFQKVILDEAGHVPSKLGLNQYSIKTIVDLQDNRYFIISEMYIDTMGKEHNTNNYYAVDTFSGNVFIARKIREGEYILNTF